MGDIKLRPYQQAAIDALKNGPKAVVVDFESRHSVARQVRALGDVHLSSPPRGSVHRIDVHTLLPKHTLMYYHVQSAIMCWQ